MKKVLIISFFLSTVCLAQEAWTLSTDCSDHSNIREKGSLAWTLAKIGNNQAEIKLPGTKVYSFKEKFSVPQYEKYPHQKIILIFADNAVLYVPEGKMLTLKCSIKAEKNQIFIGKGNIKIDNSQIEEFYPEWWWAKVESGTPGVWRSMGKVE
jgi:hypothetical protein